MYFCTQDSNILRQLQTAIVSTPHWHTAEATAQGDGQFLLSYLLSSRDSAASAEVVCSMDFCENSIPLVLPMSGLTAHGFHISVTELIGLLDVDVVELVHAILSEYRILIVTPHVSPSFAIRIVFSLVALVAPPLNAQSFLERRVFPLVTMNSLSEFCTRPGYIAGTTNLFFQTDPTLWDLLLLRDPVKSPNRMQLMWSPALRRDPKTTGLLSPDRAFFRHVKAGVKSHLGESWIIKQFRLYIIRLIDLATGVSEFGGADVRKNYELYNQKLSRVKSTRTFRELIDSEGFSCHSKAAQQIAGQVRRLDSLINVYVDAAPESLASADKRREEIREILRDCLSVVSTDETLTEFLLQTTKFDISFDALQAALSSDFGLFHEVRLLYNKIAVLRHTIIQNNDDQRKIGKK